MLFHVKLGQFDTDGETLHNQNNSRELDRYNIDTAPFIGVDPVGSMRSEDDTAQRRDGSFANVHALLDERRAEHKQRGEAAKNDIHQVRLGDVEVVPRHLGNSLSFSREMREGFGDGSERGREGGVVDAQWEASQEVLKPQLLEIAPKVADF